MYVHAYQRYSRNSVSAQLVEQSVFSQPLKMKTWNVWQALTAFWLATHRLCFFGWTNAKRYYTLQRFDRKYICFKKMLDIIGLHNCYRQGVRVKVLAVAISFDIVFPSVSFAHSFLTVPGPWVKDSLRFEGILAH